MKSLLLICVLLFELSIGQDCDCADNTHCKDTRFAVFKDGLYWAWVSPCSGGCSQLIDPLPWGWRRATDAEFALGYPSSADFIQDDAGVAAKFVGQRYIGEGCGAHIFDPTWDHCDTVNWDAGLVTNKLENSYWETVMVHDCVEDPIVDVDCVTETGGAAVYPVISSISCDAGYSLVGCNAFGTHPHEIYGSWISNDVCYATGGESAKTPTYAKARCCQLPACSACAAQTSSGDGLATSVCPVDTELTGCAANTNDNHDTNRFQVGAAGVDPNNSGFSDVSGIVLNSQLDTENTCSASGFQSNTGDDYLEAVAACCSVPENYELNCFTEWNMQSNSGTFGSCPDRYFMTSCIGRNNYYERANDEWAIDFYYVTDNDECATQMNNYEALYAQYTCCQLIKNDDDVPCETCDQYIYINDGQTRTRDVALNYCNNNYGTNLATILDDDDMDCALDAIGDGPDAWIGLNSLDNDIGFFTYDNAQCPAEHNGLFSGACLGPKMWCNKHPINCEIGSECVGVSSDNDGCVNNDIDCADSRFGVLCNTKDFEDSLQPVCACDGNDTPCDQVRFAVFKNGLYWAWVSPCSGGCSQLTHPIPWGWRRATDAEFAMGYPSSAEFIQDDAGNPLMFNGQQYLGEGCSANIFDPSHDHCDTVNWDAGLVTNKIENYYWETTLVHDPVC